MQKPEICLVDIDGTIANCEHRKHYIDNVIRVGDIVSPRNISNASLYAGKVEAIEDERAVVNDWLKPLPEGWPKYHKYPDLNMVRKHKCWNKFFEACKDDSPIQSTIDVVKALSNTWSVVFMSGRPETYREVTESWLNKNGLLFMHKDVTSTHPYAKANLFMRPAKDTREDFIVKKELYLKYIEPYYKVQCVFDDRDQVVKMWRELGLTCYQVAEGNF